MYLFLETCNVIIAAFPAKSKENRERALQNGIFGFKPGLLVTKMGCYLQHGTFVVQTGFSGYNSA
ncbi:hypothetical protein, partial [Clostridium sp. MCC353]|uniref:hypothetical protein n=1 Tax=Clostridium sp. MCC353 TaxID=2592646 RepID=UPI001C026B96